MKPSQALAKLPLLPSASSFAQGSRRNGQNDAGSGARPATVLQATTARDAQRLVTKRELYNLRAKLDQGPKNCVADLVAFLHDNNYVVLYDVNEERKALKTLFLP
ncbi:hypothetical protein VTP01DRAFT_4272 [Rhizomucor pusillus]|uniref:uncharacterized protein n=1 Tax=Rhizomucor pusillus TaxID=4840 RepID=UPI003742CE72